MFILVNPKVSNPPTFSTPKKKKKVKKDQKAYLICTLLSGHYVPVVFPELVRFCRLRFMRCPDINFLGDMPHTRTCHNICEAIRLQEVLPRVLGLKLGLGLGLFMNLWLAKVCFMSATHLTWCASHRCRPLFHTIPYQTKPNHSIPFWALQTHLRAES